MQRVYVHERVQEDRGKVALMRGPVVYCLEAIDHAGEDVARMALSLDANLRAEHRPDLLGGMTVVTGEALAEGQQLMALTAVPYYAWCNRDKGPMTVWINEVPVSDQ